MRFCVHTLEGVALLCARLAYGDEQLAEYASRDGIDTSMLARHPRQATGIYRSYISARQRDAERDADR